MQHSGDILGKGKQQCKGPAAGMSPPHRGTAGRPGAGREGVWEGLRCQGKKFPNLERTSMSLSEPN